MIVSFENLTAEEKIIKSIAFLNRHFPFFARIMLSLERHQVSEDSDIKTMGVNQFGHLFFNEEFTNSLTFEQIQGTLAHECGHVAFLTFQRQKHREHQLWNIATDIAINWILVDAGMSLPDGALIPSSAGVMELPLANLSINVKDVPAEKIYELLEKEAEKVKKNYHTLDSHLQGDSDGDGGNTGEQGNGKGKSLGSNEKNEQKWKQVCANASAFAKNRGKISGAIERILDGILAPKLNWKELLNRYITRELPFDYTYRRPGKKSYASGFYMPMVVKENLAVVVTCDVSGSISNKEYKDFMSEVLGIVSAYEQVKARVLFWSTYIDPRDDKEVDRDTARELITYKAHSSGGTTMGCVAEYVEENGINSRIFIHLTDGYIENNPKLPEGTNICVISSNGSDAYLKDHAICCSLSDDGK